MSRKGLDMVETLQDKYDEADAECRKLAKKLKEGVETLEEYENISGKIDKLERFMLNTAHVLWPTKMKQKTKKKLDKSDSMVYSGCRIEGERSGND